jgi:Protein of unknown function (DUF3352)
MSETESNEVTHPGAPSNTAPSNTPPSPAPLSDSPTIAWTPPPDETIAALSAPLGQATPPAPTRRTSRLRWFVAALVTVLVVSLTAAATLLITGQTPGSTLVGYVDNSSVVYVEARLDLPGDQRQKLGQFLSAFPGFDDQSILDRKLDEALDQLIDRSTNGKQNWSTKIKPWFGGEIALGAAPPTAPNPGDIPLFHGLVAVKVRDGAAAMAWLKDALGDTPVATQSYNGTDILIVGSSNRKGAAAVADGKALLIGDEASVRKAIDSHGNGTFAQSDSYKQARSALSNDQLGFVVVDTKAYMNILGQLSTGASGTPMLPSAVKDLLPSWMAMSVRAEGDALAVNIALPHIAAMDVGDNRPSEILPHLPASTIFVADGRDLGANWKKLLDIYREMPGFGEALKELDTALNTIGGFDKVVGWIHDGALVVTRNGATVGGGLVFTSTDAAAAQSLFSSLRNAAALGGAQAGIKITDETYNGATITTIDVGDIQDLMGAAGAGSAFGRTLPEGHLKVAYAVTDQLVIAGVGDAFVKAVLDTQPGASLASDSRFKAAADRAGGANRGLTYVDISAARELIENLIPASERAEYEKNYKPYLLPLQAFVVSNREDGSLDRAGEWLVVGK